MRAAQVAAGLGAVAPRMQAHLLGEAGDAQARQPAGDADRVERAEQLERAVFGALGAGDARHRAEAEQHRLGQAAALQHVEAVGEQRRRPPPGCVALPQRRPRAALPASQANGLRRPRSASARASAGRSSFSASSTWPSHR